MKVQHFWSSFETWLSSFSPEYICNVKSIIFGICHNSALLFNYCVLYAKWYLHKCYIQNNNISFKAFLLYLKYVTTIDKLIACKNDNSVNINSIHNILENHL